MKEMCVKCKKKFEIKSQKICNIMITEGEFIPLCESCRNKFEKVVERWLNAGK